jgi:hypothetical protein
MNAIDETKLVDQLLRAIKEGTDGPEIKTFVGHRSPDDDVWLNFFIAKKFIEKAANAEFVLVNAGQTYGESGDPSIIHFDTGRGEYDQHEKGLRRTCSAAILAEKLGVSKDPGLISLLELVTKVDNVEVLDMMNIHYIIEGYPRIFKTPQGPDWKMVQQRVFELFEIIYCQETGRSKSHENLKKFGETIILRNGIKLTNIFWHPECREAAFKTGADVVVWTRSKGKKGFYTGIQVNREPKVYLDNVAESLRFQENKIRGIIGKYLKAVGKNSCWYLHDSRRLILNGSRTCNLSEGEYTKMAPRYISGLIAGTLSLIPRKFLEKEK